MNLKLYIPVLLLITACSVKEQDPKAIVQKSFEACQAVHSGSYVMTHRMKYMSEKDTLISSFHCTFNRTKGDTLFPSRFHNKIFEEGQYVGEILYNGNELVTAYTHDSVATRMPKKLWAEDVQSMLHNFNFYNPFISGGLKPIKKSADFLDSSYSFSLVGEEKINNTAAWHVQIRKTLTEEDIAEGLFRTEFHYWIRRSDFIPVQYTMAYALIMDKDTMYQYEKTSLDSFALHTSVDEKNLQPASIPSFYKRKDYVPFVEPVPLPLDTVAPGWELLSLNDKKISLSSLKGKLVLVDFFYKSCAPCIQAMPVLQRLYQKYKDKGFALVGINPFDAREDGIAEFIDKKGVTYPVLLGGEKTAELYRVYGYPTLFLISKTGRIIYLETGFGPEMEAALDELISKNLKGA